MDGPPHEAEDGAAEPGAHDAEDNDEEMESEDEVEGNEDRSEEGSGDDNDDSEDDGSDAVSGWEDEEEGEMEGETTGVVQRLFMAADLEVAVRQLEETPSTGMRPGSLTFQVKNRPILLRGDNEEENDDNDDDDNNSNNNDDDQGGVDRTAALFGRFVTLLGADQRLGHVAGTLSLEGYRLDQHGSFPAQDVERLFGNVLRSLPALKKLKFEKCTLPGPCLGLLASASLPAPSCNLTSLELIKCDIDSEGVSHVASMVRHSACRLRVLTVVPTNGGLDPADCQVLCESVPHCRTLRLLFVRTKTVLTDTLRGSAGSGSPLKALYVTGAFTDDGAASLARQLRTNTRLVDLFLAETSSDYRLHLVPHVLRLLGTYNMTLRFACVYRDSGDDEDPTELETFQSSFVRNRWIRTAVRRLEPRYYRVSPTGLWPLVYEAKAVGTFPTLLYRLLRRGDVDALCEAVVRRHTATMDARRGEGPQSLCSCKFCDDMECRGVI
jgi:hypothetical protein